MGGGLMQLVAYGAQDIYLTGNDQIRFRENGQLLVFSELDEKTIEANFFDEYNKRLEVLSNDDCIICCECMTGDKAIDCICCKKIFHVKCVGTWTKNKNTCPHCRTPWKN